MLKYQTDLPIADVPALERESDDIWEIFRVDVENARLTNAIISASSRPSGGLVTTGRSYNFVYVKGPDGAWQRQPNP